MNWPRLWENVQWSFKKGLKTALPINHVGYVTYPNRVKCCCTGNQNYDMFEEETNGMLNRTVLCIRINVLFYHKKILWHNTRWASVYTKNYGVYTVHYGLVFIYNYMHTTNVDEPSVCNICTVSTNSIQ